MIGNQEIERYKQFALTMAASGDRVSAKEENLARMVINLVQVIDHLCASGLAVGLECENRRGPYHQGDCTCAHNFTCPIHRGQQ